MNRFISASGEREKEGRPPRSATYSSRRASHRGLATFGLRALPPGAVLENVKIDAALRKKVLDGVASNLQQRYIDPALAQQMVEALKTHASKGDYDTVSDGDVLAAQLTKDLQVVSHDRHLNVNFSPFQMPARTGPTPEDEVHFHQQMEHDNCAFRKMEILPSNIGYIQFNAFLDAGFCGPTVVAAMGFVAHTEELIFDLRQNGGGQPALVTMVASSLFDRPTHLIDIHDHKEDTTAQNWTLSYLPGPRLTKQPVFVLISKRTFSGAEEFAFDLKNQKRATIVGETTDRGAHPVSGHPVADYFMVGVPFAKSPGSGDQDELGGNGMEPDVKVPATDALTPPGNWRSKIRAKKDSKEPVDSISVWPMTNAARNRKHRATIGILRRYRQASVVPTSYSGHF